MWVLLKISGGDPRPRVFQQLIQSSRTEPAKAMTTIRAGFGWMAALEASGDLSLNGLLLAHVISGTSP